MADEDGELKQQLKTKQEDNNTVTPLQVELIDFSPIVLSQS